MRSFTLAAFLFACSACSAQSAGNWNYQGKTGPLVWGKLDPSYQACSRGHQQSPVDIRGAHLNTALQPIEFHYIGQAVTLTNDGRGIVVTLNPGSYIVADGVRYNLVRYEFHRPSEHTVKGKFADMEVDLVHRSDDGKEAIVSVRLNEDRGNPNATLATLWEHLPTRAGASEKITDMVSAGGFLPGDRGYWTYIGSELTPPCTEGVRWFVFENDISMSRGQLRAFTNLFRMNTRPLQDLHGRRIEANE
ncbi:MAG TPA: carbonic anhydrase family protein [Terracidiphilus sp.]|jgi:carbonic anhydrase|nr:carbonic anhydrase family protein [Terracidiphilus sp.]